jgi:hypothetical protein
VTRRVCVVVAIVAAACGKGREASPTPAASSGAPAGSADRAGSADSADRAGSGAATDRAGSTDAGVHCAPLPFAASTPVPEASAAAWLAESIAGKPALLVVADSGNAGAYGLVDPETGATTETGKLPLSDDVSDDLEGLSARGDRIYGLTSSGWILVWQRRGAGFALVGAPYPLGPVDLPDTKNNDRPPKGDGMVCGAHGVNCGRNYEGLCLAAAPRSPDCIGFAASRADGHVYCLSEQAGRLVVHHDRAIAVARPGTLADCTFADDGALWAGSNLFGLGRVYRVTAWDDPAHAQVELVAPLLVGNPEVIAVRGDVVYRMSDMDGAPSPMAKFRCTR